VNLNLLVTHDADAQKLAIVVVQVMSTKFHVAAQISIEVTDGISAPFTKSKAHVIGTEPSAFKSHAPIT